MKFCVVITDDCSFLILENQVLHLIHLKLFGRAQPYLFDYTVLFL